MGGRAGPSTVPVLHLVTNDRVLGRERFLASARALLHGGGSKVALHVRGERASGGSLFAVAEALAPVARRSGSWLVVNDRVDVARSAGAHGVHLRRRSLPVAEARRVLGPEGGIGVSTHTPAEAADALREGAGWIFAGTIHETPSHPGVPGGGPELVRQVTGAAPGLPALAIGGITPDRIGAVLAAGAWGVAVISGVWEAPEPMSALDEYLAALAEPAGARAART